MIIRIGQEKSQNSSSVCVFVKLWFIKSTIRLKCLLIYITRPEHIMFMHNVSLVSAASHICCVPVSQEQNICDVLKVAQSEDPRSSSLAECPDLRGTFSEVPLSDLLCSKVVTITSRKPACPALLN